MHEAFLIVSRTFFPEQLRKIDLPFFASIDRATLEELVSRQCLGTAYNISYLPHSFTAAFDKYEQRAIWVYLTSKMI